MRNEPDENWKQTMDNSLTVLITCKNERKNIRSCIESVRGLAQEILIADSGSTDGTLDIVRQMGGCRIIEREYVNSYDFRNWAIPQASHPWVMVLDSDERIPESLAKEIRLTLADGAKNDGYWILRNNYFMGHRVRFSGWRTDKVLRLFRKNMTRFVGDTDHAQAMVSTGRVGRFKNRMDHYTYWTYDQYFQKFHRYTTLQAQVWDEYKKRPGYLRMLLCVPTRFLHTYIFRLGCLDGFVGLQICALTAFYSFAKQARLWELCHAVPQPDPEKGEQGPADSKMRSVAIPSGPSEQQSATSHAA